MIIDFSRAVEGEYYSIDEVIPLDNSLTGSRDGRFLKNAVLKGHYIYFDGVLTVDCVLETEAEFACDRCGTPTIVKYKVPVRESFFKDPPDEMSLSYDDELVELMPIINERVILATPSQVLCKKDCKGLCPICGKNLNEGNCDCKNNNDGENENADSPFSVLKNMNLTGGASNGSTKK